jgi:hypothetical protein
LGLPAAGRGARFGTVWLLAGAGSSTNAPTHITIVQFRQKCSKRIELRSAVREVIEEPARTTVKFDTLEILQAVKLHVNPGDPN